MKLTLESQYSLKNERGGEGGDDWHWQTCCQENRGDPRHRDIRESKKGGREVTSNKNLKAKCMKPQRDCGTSNAVSPWHSTSKKKKIHSRVSGGFSSVQGAEEWCTLDMGDRERTCVLSLINVHSFISHPHFSFPFWGVVSICNPD